MQSRALEPGSLNRARENAGFSAGPSRNLPWAGPSARAREGASMITHTLPKPAPNIVGLAWDGAALWAGDYNSCTLFRLAEDGTAAEQFAAPGRMVGMTFLGGTLVAVISDPNTGDRRVRGLGRTKAQWDAGVQRFRYHKRAQLSWDGK